jgi:hypothetical protein
MEANAADHQIAALVKQAIDAADPIHLLAIGAPEDEYASEIREIVARLAACTTLDALQTLVHAVFVTWFDADLAGHGGGIRPHLSPYD